MRFTADRKELLSAVKTCKTVIPGNSSVPILACVKIETGKDHIKVIGTDLFAGILIEVPATVYMDGATVLAPKQLINVLNVQPCKEVEIELDEDTAIMRCPGHISSIRLKTIPAEEYPQIWDGLNERIKSGQTFQLSGDILQEIIAKVAYAADADLSYSQPILSGVYLETSPKLVAVGCDVHRLSIRTFSLSDLPQVKVIIPVSELKKAGKVFKKHDISMTFDQASERIYFVANGITYLSRTITGNYLGYDRPISDIMRNRTIEFTISRSALLGAVEQIIAITPKKVIGIAGLKFTADTLQVTAIDSDDECSVTLPIHTYYWSETPDTLFNANYLKDCLLSYTCETIILRTQGGLYPLMVESNPDHQCCIWPVKLS
jgi:DNA polymerase-3 subunit beta